MKKIFTRKPVFKALSLILLASTQLAITSPAFAWGGGWGWGGGGGGQPSTYSIGGSVTGLTSGSVTLANGSDSVTQSGNGGFTFPTKLTQGSSYSVTISSQPAGETCIVANGSGTVNSSNVTNVSVSCSASAASGKSQVMILLSNSESMDGNVNGAILTGSGAGAGSSSAFYSAFAGTGANYSGTGPAPVSPDTYSIPSGFSEPCSYLTGGCGTGSAAGVTIPSGSAAYSFHDSNGVVYDNSPSRLNIAKESIQSIVQTYIKSIDIGLMDYSINNPQVLQTWLYLMSGSGGFTLSNSPSAGAVPNPCYNQTGNKDCAAVSKSLGYSSSYITGYKYLIASASSDDPSINDVLYASGLPSAFLEYGNVNPGNPYSYFTLSDYNKGKVKVSYGNASSYYASGFVTSPTNAGYVPFSPQVFYAQRGFGWYDDSENPNTGHIVVPLTSSGAAPTTTASVNTAIGAFSAALAPETSSTSTAEIKAAAVQAPTAGMLTKALSYFNSLPALQALPGSCSTPTRSIVLITDGLPTEDLNGYKWPPLGSDAATGYGEYATFNSDGSVASTNDQALTDTITAIQNLVNADVNVYVIGLGAGVNGANAYAQQTLTAMAVAGNTKKFYTASDSTSLLDALNQIFSTSLSGPVISAAVTTPGSVVTGSYAYNEVSDNNDGSKQGHLYAYPISSTGNASTNPAWDAAAPVFQSNRGSLLWSDAQNTNKVQAITAWNSLPASVFAASGTPSATTISAYTIDPNSAGGIYLNGRAPGSIVGTMTAKASRPIYVGPPANPLLLNTPGYAAFAQTNHARTASVLWSANDGFLYSSNASTGALNWAYMPSPLLPDLQNYTSFESSQPMNGGMAVVDGLGSDGAWHSFVMGTAQSGAIHYGFQLDASGNPSTSVPVIMDNQPGSTSPNASAPLFLWDANGVAYAVYTTVKGSTAQINVISSQGNVSHASLPFVPSSPISVNLATGDLFLGGEDGNVYTLSVSSGYTATDIAGSYDKKTSLVGTMPNPGDPAQYVGFSQTSNGLFVWATGAKQIAVFQYGGTGWATNWTTQDGGPSTNQVNGTTTTYSADPGVKGTGPQFLPATATISDASVTTNGALIVPVTTASAGSTDSCGASEAFYYLFNLTDGTFPMGQFSAPDGSSLVSNVSVGIGTAFSPTVSYNSGMGGFAVYGSAQQNNNGQSLFSLVANAKSNVSAGIVGWRPLMMTHP
jgi:type IV pilus assembly protein PilY1